MTIGVLIRRAALAGIAAAALAATPAFAQKTKLTVYTALENDQLDPFKKAFEADNPTIEIAWVRDSTGVVFAVLVAVMAAPLPLGCIDFTQALICIGAARRSVTGARSGNAGHGGCQEGHYQNVRNKQAVG